MTKPTPTDNLSLYLSSTLQASARIRAIGSQYHKDLTLLAKTFIPSDASVIEFGSREGSLLGGLPNRVKVGVEAQKDLVAAAQQKYKSAKFLYAPMYQIKLHDTFDYILINNILSFIPDVQTFIQSMKSLCHQHSRVVVVSFNFFWKPLLDFASSLGLRTKVPFEPNWLTPQDTENLFRLENFELIKTNRRLLIPLHIPFITKFFNTFLAPLPLFNSLCLTSTQVFRRSPKPKDYSVSILIAARNEEGNIPHILDRIPLLSKHMEVIFVEGHSRDNTFDAIKQEIHRYKGPIQAFLFKQQGKGKKDAIELGFRKAKNELVIILDADLTVNPDELPKFYNAIGSGKAELVIGSRLVYPMERQAMRLLNYFGNKFFSLAFSFLLDTSIKDTLCGTKALLKSTYDRIGKIKRLWGNIDPYGDFDLIFGASKLNLKIMEIPIRYKERSYGTSNISRFEHGLLLFRMTLAAARKLKFI